ncbi:MAG: DUF559 domain-containing protein [Aestuariivirga sp.]|nr:DUF559 domain-containing protein [Aestuariivirga sp.]
MLSPQQLERARRLRRIDTECERRLWAKLRDRRLNGFKFVRQLPVGPFVADFACREVMLIVEVDGATHSTAEEHSYDARRTVYLEANGWRVLRVRNDDVLRNIDDVLEGIVTAVVR